MEPKGRSGEGCEVSLEDALPGISLYKMAMWEHGSLDTSKGHDVFSPTGKIRMITESERYEGERLIERMVNLEKNYSSVHSKKLGIRLSFGIYTNMVCAAYYLNFQPRDAPNQEKNSLSSTPGLYPILKTIPFTTGFLL